MAQNGSYSRFIITGGIIVFIIGIIFLILWGLGVFKTPSTTPATTPATTPSTTPSTAPSTTPSTTPSTALSTTPSTTQVTRQFFNTYVLSDDNSWKYWDTNGVETSGDDNQLQVNNLFNTQNIKAEAEFGDTRVLILLLPGTHTLNIKVGYYTSVVGVGASPEDTVVNGSIEVPNNPDPCIGALDNFYRNISNLTINVLNKDTNSFRVSQASPIRNIIVQNGNFAVAEWQPNCDGVDLGGYSSGGYMANVQIVDGILDFSTQQQFFTRNSEFKQTDGGSWNLYFIGCNSDIAPNNCPVNNNTTLVTSTPEIPGPITAAPRILYQSDGRISIIKPKIYTNSSGILANSEDDEELTNVFIVNSQTDIQTINEKLAAGIHLIFSPFIYSFSEPIRITRSGTVVLGLGYATIVPTAANAAIIIADGTEGVRVCGFILQAGDEVGGATTNALLVVGETENSGGNSENPNILFDIFPRVGGPDLTGTCDVMILVNQQNTIFDHIWCWRADHVGVLEDERSGLGPDKAKVDNAIVVNADNVTMFGVFAEHTLKEQIIWNGNQGRLFFQQTELPYDVAGGWNFPGLKVTGQNFFGSGIGIYSFFAQKWHEDDNAPDVSTAVITPDDATVESCFTIFLDPSTGGGSILSVINGKGTSSDITNAGQPQWWLCTPGDEWSVCQNNPDCV